MKCCKNLPFLLIRNKLNTILQADAYTKPNYSFDFVLEYS